jgi:hypothetical protein
MGTAALVCNVVLLAITGLIILTEGLPGEGRYQVLTLLMLLIPLLTAAVLVLRRIAPQRSSAGNAGASAITVASRTAVLGNVLLFGASCWAAVVQYPYPEGNSVIPFAVLAVCTPILSLLTLLHGGRNAMRALTRPRFLAS